MITYKVEPATEDRALLTLTPNGKQSKWDETAGKYIDTPDQRERDFLAAYPFSGTRVGLTSAGSQMILCPSQGAARDERAAFYAAYYRKFSRYNTENDRILDKLVEREVLCNLTGFAEYILALGDEYGSRAGDPPFTRDDIENSTAPGEVKADQYRYIVHDANPETFSATLYEIDSDGEDEEIFQFTPEHYPAFAEWIKAKGEEDEDTYSAESPDVAGEYFFTQIDKEQRAKWRNVTMLDENDDVQRGEEEYQDIYEWWGVRDYFMGKLKDAGEPVVDSYPCLWGRTSTGQGIALDSPVQQIAYEMEILYGMRNEW